MSADKHRKKQFVKHHAVASFLFLLCVCHVCIQRPLVTVSSHPSDISPNVNSINAQTWNECWFTNHKLLYERGWHAFYCPRLFIAKRLQECCHCCSFTDVSALCCCGFASPLCERVSWLLFSFLSGRELLSHGRQDLSWLPPPACPPQLLLIASSMGQHLSSLPAACRHQSFSDSEQLTTLAPGSFLWFLSHYSRDFCYGHPEFFPFAFYHRNLVFSCFWLFNKLVNWESCEWV